VGRRPGLEARGGEQQGGADRSQERDIASRGSLCADGQPGGDGGDEGDPFEGELWQVGEELAAPAAELDADRDRVDSDHRQDEQVTGQAADSTLRSAEQPEHERRGENAQIVGQDGDPVADAAGQRGVGWRRPGDGRVEAREQAPGERDAEHQAAGSSGVVALG
jgi:hypothetical protein